MALKSFMRADEGVYVLLHCSWGEDINLRFAARFIEACIGETAGLRIRKEDWHSCWDAALCVWDIAISAADVCLFALSSSIKFYFSH